MSTKFNVQSTGPDWDLATDYNCDRCHNTRFVVQYIMKHFSVLASPTGQEQLVPIQVFSCTKCDHINDDFLPKQQSNTTDKSTE